MSIKVIIQASGFNLQAIVKDEALTELIRITQEFRDQEAAATTAPAAMAANEPAAKSAALASNEESVRAQLAGSGAAELLNHIRWETYAEKILLLAAWYEARGENVPWKSADMDAVFKQAKEGAPSNFPRDIKVAIKSGWIHAHTPRTYSVTRTGWNKITEALSKIL
ncbi:MAG: hypothetical protein ACR2OZ_08190 [Verrucomicrobiales bacterium]